MSDKEFIRGSLEWATLKIFFFKDLFDQQDIMIWLDRVGQHPVIKGTEIKECQWEAGEIFRHADEMYHCYNYYLVVLLKNVAGYKTVLRSFTYM